MNTAASLKLKIKLITALNQQAQCDQLVESELEDFKTQKEELVHLGSTYIDEVEPDVLRKAMSSSAWISPLSENALTGLTDEAMVEEAQESLTQPIIFVLEGLRKLTEVADA